MPPASAKVVFMGSPDFSVPTLEVLRRSQQFEVALVVTQPDRPKGRGRQVSPTPVRSTAQALGIPVKVIAKENYKEIFEKASRFEPDFIIVAAFGVILKKDLLELPKYGCINLHASLLPKYRGVSPIPAAILAGDKVTGCTTMLMDEGIDTGDILLRCEVEITREETSGSLSEKLALMGADLMIRTLEGFIGGDITPLKQDDEKATYTKKLNKSDGRIDWTCSAVRIERLVRAMHPWPSAFTFFDGKRLIIIRAKLGGHASSAHEPGEILSANPFVVCCGEGALEITELKVQGKRAQAAGAFTSGYRVKAGILLGESGAHDI